MNPIKRSLLAKEEPNMSSQYYPRPLHGYQRGGTVILEMAPHQTDYAAEIAIGQGYSDVKITDDLTGRKRIVSCTCRD